MTILQWILKVLQTNGGKMEGTKDLCQMVPASPASVCRTLNIARRKHLVISTRVQGGRGNRSIHSLTAKGMEYANHI